MLIIIIAAIRKFWWQLRLSMSINRKSTHLNIKKKKYLFKPHIKEESSSVLIWTRVINHNRKICNLNIDGKCASPSHPRYNIIKCNKVMFNFFNLNMDILTKVHYSRGNTLASIIISYCRPSDIRWNMIFIEYFKLVPKMGLKGLINFDGHLFVVKCPREWSDFK